MERDKNDTEFDKDGYRGCPKCESFRITFGGSSIDYSSLVCNDCGFGISGDDDIEMMGRWNNIKREKNYD